MSDIKEGSKEDIDQRFRNDIEFFRYEFSIAPHMIQENDKREVLSLKWKQNKKVNPLTHRKIKKHGESWRKLARLTGSIIKASDIGLERFEVTTAE